jgi:hypothetical protein
MKTKSLCVWTCESLALELLRHLRHDSSWLWNGSFHSYHKTKTSNESKTMPLLWHREILHVSSAVWPQLPSLSSRMCVVTTVLRDQHTGSCSSLPGSNTKKNPEASWVLGRHPDCHICPLLHVEPREPATAGAPAWPSGHCMLILPTETYILTIWKFSIKSASVFTVVYACHVASTMTNSYVNTASSGSLLLVLFPKVWI